MIKILAACGAGINSSHQIKDALEKEMKNRGYSVTADAVVVKDITESMIKKYDIFAPIANTNLGFAIPIPVVDSGPILYRVPALAKPVFDQIEAEIKKMNK